MIDLEKLRESIEVVNKILLKAHEGTIGFSGLSTIEYEALCHVRNVSKSVLEEGEGLPGVDRIAEICYQHLLTYQHAEDIDYEMDVLPTAKSIHAEILPIVAKMVALKGEGK